MYVHADILFLTHKALLSLGWRYEQSQPIAKVGAFLYCVQTPVSVEKSRFTTRFFVPSGLLVIRFLVSSGQVHAVAICGVGLQLRNRVLWPAYNLNIAPPQASTEGLFQQTRLFASMICEMAITLTRTTEC